MPTLGTVDWTDGEVEFHTFFLHSTAAAACLLVCSWCERILELKGRARKNYSGIYVSISRQGVLLKNVI